MTANPISNETVNPANRFGLKWVRFIRHCHRWLGLFLAIQVILWMASGVFMSWFDIRLVRGETVATQQFPIALVAQNFVAPGGIIAQTGEVESITLTRFMGEPVYRVTRFGRDMMFDALTGEQLTPLAKETVQQIANTDYSGSASIQRALLLTNAPGEYRGAFPVWQVQFADRLKTRLYISPDNGRVLARRNNIWRIYDFLWMLHIMDYGEREDFNNPLLKIFSASGLLFALTGMFIVISQLMSGRYRRSIRNLFFRRPKINTNK